MSCAWSDHAAVTGPESNVAGPEMGSLCHWSVGCPGRDVSWPRVSGAFCVCGDLSCGLSASTPPSRNAQCPCRFSPPGLVSSPPSLLLSVDVFPRLGTTVPQRGHEIPQLKRGGRMSLGALHGPNPTLTSRPTQTPVLVLEVSSSTARAPPQAWHSHQASSSSSWRRGPGPQRHNAELMAVPGKGFLSGRT